MKMKLVIPFILALAFGILAAKIGQNLLRNRPSPQASLLDVVVADKELDIGREIAVEDLSHVSLPPESLPPQAVRDPGQVVGRVLMVPVGKGQMLLSGFLAPDGSGAGIQALIPNGQRAVTIEVNEYNGMEGLLIPGCKVDVVATLQDEQTRNSVTRTILENVKVLAVGTQTAPRSADKELVARSTKSVTLVVTPREAEALDLTTTRARPRLVLRSRKDAAMVATSGVTLAELMRNGSDEGSAVLRRIGALLSGPTTQPASVRTVQARRSVHVIKGGAETIKNFEIVTPAASGTQVVEVYGAAPERSHQ